MQVPQQQRKGQFGSRLLPMEQGLARAAVVLMGRPVQMGQAPSPPWSWALFDLGAVRSEKGDEEGGYLLEVELPRREYQRLCRREGLEPEALPLS